MSSELLSDVKSKLAEAATLLEKEISRRLEANDNSQKDKRDNSTQTDSNSHDQQSHKDNGPKYNNSDQKECNSQQSDTNGETGDREADEDKYRVLHYVKNPYNEHFNRQREAIKRLTSENERLGARIKLLETGSDADMTRKIEDAVETAHELESLREQVKEAKKREAKILTSFKNTSREFRVMCYLLTGFKIDGLKERKYRLSSMYAESPDDVLYFHSNPDGTVQLLENEYTERLTEYIETYLERADSYPAFLAAITMDLFKASTQAQ